MTQRQPSVSDNPLSVQDALRTDMTYEDYLKMPEDGKYYQLFEGALVMNPSPNVIHQRISRNLQEILLHHIKKHHLGVLLNAPIDVVLAHHVVFQPDLVFVHRDHRQIVTKRAIEGTPDLVVEILSPSTRKLDRADKMRLYAIYGVPHYWIIDPDEETFEVFALNEGHYVLKTVLDRKDSYIADELEHLTIVLDEVFKEDVF